MVEPLPRYEVRQSLQAVKIGIIFGFVAIWLGVDVAWDAYIGIGTVCFAVAMLRHPRFGAVLAAKSTVDVIICDMPPPNYDEEPIEVLPQRTPRGNWVPPRRSLRQRKTRVQRIEVYTMHSWKPVVLVSRWLSRSNVKGRTPDRVCPASLCRRMEFFRDHRDADLLLEFKFPSTRKRLIGRVNREGYAPTVRRVIQCVRVSLTSRETDGETHFHERFGRCSDCAGIQTSGTSRGARTKEPGGVS